MLKPTIGLEVHCELKSNTKNFSGAVNAYSTDPNTNVSPVDLGMPGILPVVNQKAIDNSLKVALALNCELPETIYFDRKNYFYPDLPKGYQITQLDKPVGINGYVEINVDGEDKKIFIHDTHLEEDTASMDHYTTYSLIDYNRAGVPLLETVTEPCIHSADEAISFLETLKNIFLYLGVSDARADLGQIRCDVNVSMSENDDLGVRVEMKNISSFTGVRLAIETEIKRQTEIIESGEKVLQETRRFSEVEMKTYKMRSKEDAIDYKYFTEPNIPPIVITEEYIEQLKSAIPELQIDRIRKYKSFNISDKDIKTLTRKKVISDYFDSCYNLYNNPIVLSNWITSIIIGQLNKLELEFEELYTTPSMLVELLNKLEKNEISSKQAKEVLFESMEDEIEPAAIIEEKGIKQMGSGDELKELIDSVFNDFPDAKSEYKSGKTNILDFLVGQVMKKSRGQANPATTRILLKEELEN